MLQGRLGKQEIVQCMYVCMWSRFMCKMCNMRLVRSKEEVKKTMKHFFLHRPTCNNAHNSIISIFLAVKNFKLRLIKKIIILKVNKKF